jgi:hypothetical protein
MTFQEFFDLLDKYPLILILYFLFLPLFSLALKFILKKNETALSPWKYVYSVIIYLSCIPGIFIVFTTLYLAVFRKTNLLDLSIFVYFLPIISMFFTLIIVRKSIAFDDIPGFKKITGLFTYIVCTFIILLILERLRIFLFFHGSILVFFLIWAVIFFALRIATKQVFGKFKQR